MTEAINPVDSILPFIAAAVQEWKAENTEEKITRTITDLLNKESKRITLKLLGFEESCGTWRVDHCNGRSGNSAAGDFLRRVQQEAIQGWLTSVSMPDLDKKTQNALLRDAKAEYQSTLSQMVRELARAQAKQDAQSLIEELVESKLTDNYVKAMKLIDAN